jgi:hypothetical protein
MLPLLRRARLGVERYGIAPNDEIADAFSV